MTTFRKAITAPPSPCLQVMTPPGSPPRESCLGSMDKDDLKQLFVDAIRQVLSKMPVAPASSSQESQVTTASLLTDLLEVFQGTPSSDATTGPSTSASVGVEKDNHRQLPCDSRGATLPNSPCITPSEPVAIFQLKEPTDLLVHAPDDPRAYSVYAEKPRDTAGDCKVSGNPKSSVTLNDVDVATLQNLRPVNSGQSTPNTVDTAATGGQRLVAGARASKVEVRKTRGVCDCDIKKGQYKLASTHFGPSTPQLDAEELEKLLANVADTRGQADSSDTADALGFCEAREIGSEDLRGERQGSPHPESSHIPSEPINNVIKLADNVAMSDGVQMRASHVRSALTANGYSIPAPGFSIDNSLYDE